MNRARHGRRLVAVAALLTVMGFAGAPGRLAGGDPPGQVAHEANRYRPADFQGITPGKTTANRARAILGKPDEVGNAAEGATRWTYHDIGSFRAVDLYLRKGRVQTILMHLDRMEPVDAVAEQLELDRFVPVEIADGDRALGMVYPERGVLLTYAEAAGNMADRKVDRVAIEPLTGEPFWLRARFGDRWAWSSHLADLRAARRFGWFRPDVVTLEAAILFEVRRYEEARRTLGLVPKDELPPRGKILLARVLAALGDREKAQTILSEVERSADGARDRAEARLRRGQLQSRGLDRAMGKAAKTLSQALALAESAAKKGQASDRNRAAELVLEAHLALADTIARGPFRDQRAVVDEWCESAERWLEKHAELRKAPVWRFRTRVAIVLALSREENPPPLDAALKALDEAARDVQGAITDRLVQDALRWEEAEARTTAARALARQGRGVQARLQVARARALWDAIAEPKGRVARQLLDYERGVTAFQRGSIAAVFQKDHALAVRQYRAALARFDATLPPAAEDELGLHGERFVSMGVSFWEVGERERAIELTRRGARLMERAVAHRLLSPQALRVAFDNLAAMERAMGRPEEAERFERRAASLEPSKKR